VSSASDAIAFTVWAGEEDQTMLGEIIDDFKKDNPTETFSITLGVQSESTAKDTILKDPQSAADVFAYASDQLYDLAKGGCLQNVEDVLEAADLTDVETRNSDKSVEAAKYDSKLYSFPLTASNSYFLYYDSSVLDLADCDTFDGMMAKIAAKSAADGVTYKFAWPTGSGWYLGGWFDPLGLTCTLDTTNNVNVCNWNTKTATGSVKATGLEASEALMKLSVGQYKDYWLNEPDKSLPGDCTLNETAKTRVVAAINGTWNAKAIETAWNTGYNATDLPSFTVGSSNYHMESVGGYKLIGVNAYSAQTGWATTFANYLSNETNQIRRYNERGEGPTNTAALSKIDLTSNPAVAALALQSAYFFTQSVGGNFWTPSGSLSVALETGASGTTPLVTSGAGTSTLTFDETALQKVLDDAVGGIIATV
jgi:arabinogalactan oligomer/maltooligosaccharide transport system substrate-binding protein